MKSDVILQFTIWLNFHAILHQKLKVLFFYVAISIIVSLGSLSFIFGNSINLFQCITQLDEVGIVLTIHEFKVKQNNNRSPSEHHLLSLLFTKLKNIYISCLLLQFCFKSFYILYKLHATNIIFSCIFFLHLVKLGNHFFLFIQYFQIFFFVVECFCEEFITYNP